MATPGSPGEKQNKFLLLFLCFSILISPFSSGGGERVELRLIRQQIQVIIRLMKNERSQRQNKKLKVSEDGGVGERRLPELAEELDLNGGYCPFLSFPGIYTSPVPALKSAPGL